jgi:hypothetical protein
MQLAEVKDKRAAKEFIQVNVEINKNNSCYIRPLDSDINDIFDRAKNKAFRFGEATRWVLKDKAGKPIGRIAAFINSKYKNKGDEIQIGGIGFFDCINNQEAADILFDVAKHWLLQKGMEAMDGPINFGERDRWWGLMAEGFDREPIFGMPFNPRYYQSLFENYGFKNYYDQFWYGMMVDDPLPPRFSERYEKFKNKPGYVAKHINGKDLNKCAADFATVYNAAWAQHGEGKEITHEQAMKLFKKMKPVMDERMVWFAYYKEDPIAMFINIPDINQYFKYFNGKLGVIEKLRFVWMKRKGVCKKLVGVAFGVVPKYQALGIDSFMIYETALLVQNKGWYDTYEMGWAADWNPKMVNIYKNLGGNQSRKMITYRYIFDTVKNPFRRHPVMEYK